MFKAAQQYAKFIAAMVGVGMTTAASEGFEAPSWLVISLAVLTAASVYAIPNVANDGQ